MAQKTGCRKVCFPVTKVNNIRLTCPTLSLIQTGHQLKRYLILNRHTIC